MREIHPLFTDIDRYLEEALRAKQQLDAQRWRDELRPRAVRLFAARATKLRWSRALLKLVIKELYPDDLFKELVGDLDHVPPRRWPGVIAVAVALRHSWRRDGLARFTRRLRVHPRPPKRRRSSPQSKTTTQAYARRKRVARRRALVRAHPPASSRPAASPQGRDAGGR